MNNAKTQNRNSTQPPEILAPAGSQDAFLAAVGAGADAIYCGLKAYSARMEAHNFTIETLAPLTRLAHDKGVKVYVTLNSLLVTQDLDRAGGLIDSLERYVKPDALIVQDLAVVSLAQQAGFSGELHLSTLANVSFAAGLRALPKLEGVQRVVLPRELNIDEIKSVAQTCPAKLRLEVFIHGALCYGVSGRCYWSSYMGGKSGLRGRCVQPCRRHYTHDNRSGRLFSCQDFSLDVLVKVLRTIPQIAAWKIEGRKKGPHYVNQTVSAYRLLRDHGKDPAMKKEALAVLGDALGRTGTHYHMLPQRPQNPVDLKGQTGSGMLVGRVKGPVSNPYFSPRRALWAEDLLRIGYEDGPGHGIVRLKASVPKGGKFHLKAQRGRSFRPGDAVFLIDRREKQLDERIRQIAQRLDSPLPRLKAQAPFKTVFSQPVKAKPKRSSILMKAPLEMEVYRQAQFLKGAQKATGTIGIWLSAAALKGIVGRRAAKIWWWLPPVVWPDEEGAFLNRVRRVQKMGGFNFILNSPWQAILFDKPQKLNLWAGPFCNLANPLAIEIISRMGCKGAIVSPELDRTSFLELPASSGLPLGVVLSGNWPLCVARTKADELKIGRTFASPRGEQAFVRHCDSSYWVFPNWRLDLEGQKQILKEAGYALFCRLNEPWPKGVKLKKRPGKWNWDIGLK